ncbi:response regulator transcription factor [Shimazuella sp. AN120528]|uniref:response regulator transcription factor n=1 Tax=Shimazuella soli TaxID=1892854 RepID=UPI001F1003F9|nr:response regulator transcription factor [Shimazuella soli]MCH5586511.1 response regulator transcription factor [Shimazuella soli]
MARILVVDDDDHIREVVSIFLKQEGYVVEEAVHGKEALKLLDSIQVDMVILDIMMPQMDGFELCTELRKFYDFPILMLTAKGETTHKIKGFRVGTDDYLTKPFEVEELVVRVKALLRRYQIISSNRVQLGELLLDRSRHEILYKQTPISIPLKEFELLFEFANYPNRTLTREHLIERIWGYDFEGDERTIDVHVKRLRERFPEKQYDFAIRTVRGLGYRLEVVQHG